jgi:hypothetical protein
VSRRLEGTSLGVLRNWDLTNVWLSCILYVGIEVEIDTVDGNGDKET